MQKRKKNILGLLGLALVAAVTAFAYLLPSVPAFADTTSVTETIRVTVYDRFPSIKITSPDTDYVSVSPELTVGFDYENASRVEFKLTYEDEDGNIQEVILPTYEPDPSRLDPTFNFDSDSATTILNLDDYNLGYGRYILEAVSYSPIGPSTGDSIEFYYVPASMEPAGTTEDTADPIIDVDYDEGVVKIEIMPVDGDGNPLFPEPIVIEIPEPYEGGSESVVLPFSEYGIPTGEYDIVITSYRNGTDPDTGEPTLVVIDTPIPAFALSYVQPAAPDVPNTGGLFKKLNIASEDIAITAIIAFVAVAIVAFLLLARKKKDYRKNLRRK